MDYYLEIIKNCNFEPTPKLKEALGYATEMHKDQKRYSGEQYIVHPVSVTIELAKIGMDETTLIAALLHDVIEDCGVTENDLKKRFGDTVAKLVVAETKVDEMSSESHLRFSDYGALKKLLIAMSDDIRVLLIRLSDRMHNMRTIQYLKPERQITYSQETLNVYVPLAEYIGMGIWKRELEDIAFKTIDPQKYEEINQLIMADKRSNPQNIQNIQSDLEKLLLDNKLKAKVIGRIKSVSSTGSKLARKSKYADRTNISISDIKDILAVTIITQNNNIIQCYKILGLIHEKWKYSLEDFTDYISHPKPNGYRSIHTIIYFSKEIKVEIQIRTKEMHDYNEFGPASHISYKISNTKNSKPTTIFSWIRNLVQWKDQISDKSFSLDVFKNRIYVFTPKGKVIELPKDATPIDFAFHIHLKIGNSCRGAVVNGKIEHLNYKLKTADVLEIITDKKNSLPNKEWLTFVKSNTARSSIRKALNDHILNELIEKGKK